MVSLHFLFSLSVLCIDEMQLPVLAAMPCHAFPTIMDSFLLELQAKVSPFFFKMLLIMIFTAAEK